MKFNLPIRKSSSSSQTSLVSYFKLILRLCSRRLFPIVFVIICLYFITIYHRYSNKELHRSFTSNTIRKNGHNNCDFIPSTDEFLSTYQPYALLGDKPDSTRVEPTIERMRSLLEKVRSKENQYQSLLDTFDVFNMADPLNSIKPYAYGSNIDEIKMLYDRYIKLMGDSKTIQVNEVFIDYLRTISSYLSDGLRRQRTNIFPIKCNRKPVFVSACDANFFNGVQGTIRTLDTYWPDHEIVIYDMGHTNEQNQLLKKKCNRCTVIKFPFASIEKVAPHIRTLSNYAFKPFVIQDALRRYGQIIYGDSSARFNENSFDPVLFDNYIRGFAARELPGHYLSCYTRSGAFTWFNQSYTNYDNIYMAEANFLVVTDTFLTRLIMKTWLTCALDVNCLIASDTATLCSRASASVHRFDQSAMVIILTHFFFQGNQSTWSASNANDPTPYDMFTSVQKNLGDIKRSSPEANYLLEKKKTLS